MDTRIYVCTHKEFTKPEKDVYIALQVGTALHDNLDYERDDVGESISERNLSYCELTGLYWVWKNVDCDIVGISHYRRYFEYDHDFLDKEDIEKILDSYDVILPYSKYVEDGSIRKHYGVGHEVKDLDLVGDIISELCPEYKKAYDVCMQSEFFYPLNMIVTRKKLYDDYCSWLFPILFELEKRADVSNYDDYQKRMIGFVSERLLRVWIMMKKVRIYEMGVIMLDPENAYNNLLILEKKNRLIELSVSDLLTLYKANQFIDVFEFLPKELDANGRIPVWICWWQGFDSAPEIVQLCRKSVYRNLEPDLFEIKEITFENLNEYICFPDWIAEKFNNGVITMTQLSDMLRMALLYYYGGVWMDATYFVANPIGRNHPLYKDDYYTIKIKQLPWKTDVSDGRWSGNFLKFAKGSLFPRFVMNAFYYYYAQNDKSADYFMIDYFIRIAANSLQPVAEQIDGLGFNQSRCYSLVEMLSEKYDKDEFHSMMDDSDFYKLTYKKDFDKRNIFGSVTWYGKLLREYGLWND